MQNFMNYLILNIILKIIAITIPLLLAVAFLTLAERKVMASMQRRKGPNVVGVFGILQPIADGLKLLVKEPVKPSNANLIIFLFAPILTFMLSQVAWAVIPFQENVVLADLNAGLLYIFAISSLGVYGIITAGWSSNSKYAFLGSLRSAAQMVSYEVSLGLILITVLLCVGSLNLSLVVLAQQKVWFCIPLFPVLIMFFISCLAETNRAPFDLPEAEAELVAGHEIPRPRVDASRIVVGIPLVHRAKQICQLVWTSDHADPVGINRRYFPCRQTGSPGSHIDIHGLREKLLYLLEIQKRGQLGNQN
jgi:NADH-quinone oxidoreductase subunit H